MTTLAHITVQTSAFHNFAASAFLLSSSASFSSSRFSNFLATSVQTATKYSATISSRQTGLEFSRTLFVNITTSSNGGAICNTNTAGTFLVTDCGFYSCRGVNGGAVYTLGMVNNVTQCCFLCCTNTVDDVSGTHGAAIMIATNYYADLNQSTVIECAPAGGKARLAYCMENCHTICISYNLSNNYGRAYSGAFYTSNPSCSVKFGVLLANSGRMCNVIASGTSNSISYHSVVNNTDSEFGAIMARDHVITVSHFYFQGNYIDSSPSNGGSFVFESCFTDKSSFDGPTDSNCALTAAEFPMQLTNAAVFNCYGWGTYHFTVAQSHPLLLHASFGLILAAMG